MFNHWKSTSSNLLHFDAVIWFIEMIVYLNEIFDVTPGTSIWICQQRVNGDSRNSCAEGSNDPVSRQCYFFHWRTLSESLRDCRKRYCMILDHDSISILHWLIMSFGWTGCLIWNSVDCEWALNNWYHFINMIKCLGNSDVECDHIFSICCLPYVGYAKKKKKNG